MTTKNQGKTSLDKKSKDNYPTPVWLMELFSDWFDPCPLNSKFDGLKVKWKFKTYVNPPYSNPLPWVEKALKEWKEGCTIVMLLPVDTSTKWFAKLIEAKAHIFWHNGRLRFTKNPPRFASMLVILDTAEDER